MISRDQIKKVLAGYDHSKITIGVLGGHSALDVCYGAKKLGFRTLAVCQKGREKTYDQYYKTRGNLGCIDETILLDKFSDITNPDVQETLRQKNVIFIHNRYFWVYFDFEKIENDFLVPIFGSRELVKLEERDIPKNQYYLLDKAGIRTPRIYSGPDEIDRLVIVKANELTRGYERSFFFVNSPEDFAKQSQKLIREGAINEESLNKAVIEEYIVGAQINFNYFYSSLTGQLELMGLDTRRQTNLDGLLRLPAKEQLKVAEYLDPTMVETGHIACTSKESILEKIFTLGEKFVATLAEEVPPGMIGPFALQGAIASEKGKEEPVIFDVSMRLPGSPGITATPYTSYLYGRPVNYGERIAMEIKAGIDSGKLADLLT
jgi:5-formaminoimidazole-4-carboxamide-1-(beta)-D-ribofuranosyl 5'-monophosphate synthetase